MSHLSRVCLAVLFLFSPSLNAQDTHSHGAPEKLGKVSFSTSCLPKVHQQFDRGVALLHSFAYAPAENTFQGVAKLDPQCAIAHWGIAMTYFHPLWDPPLSPATISIASHEIQLARRIGANSERERKFINALALIYQNADTVPYATRALNYDHAMGQLAAENPKDVEAQVFYALALLASASPMDKTHANQKQAADLLEPLYRAYPEHPGIPHYLIHAYDNAELAPRGLAAARAYCGIAPSAPHALHCHRIYSRDSAYGRTPSLPTLRQGLPHTSRATPEKSCTRWIIWCTPTCKVDATETRLRLCGNLETCRRWI